MPIGLSNQHGFWTSLAIDQSEPEATRPAFRLRFPSWKQANELADALTTIHTRSETMAAMVEELGRLLRRWCSGWKNMRDLDGVEIPYDPARFAEILTAPEMFELLERVVSDSMLGEAEVKKSLSLSRWSAEKSAPLAENPAQPNASAG